MSWARIIPVLCISALALTANGQTLESAGRASKTPQARYTALVRFADAHPTGRDGAMALVAAALVDHAERRHEQAIFRLRKAAPRLPLLADYVAYNLAATQYDLGNFQSAIDALEPVWNSSPPSPLVPDAAILAADSYKDSGRPGDAIRVLREHYESVPQPAADALLAECAAASGNLALAAHFYQHVYFNYPNTPESARAAGELKSLEQKLGALYPPATAEMMLRRANRLADTRDYKGARAAYADLIPKLAGEEQDLARVRIGVMDYRQYKDLPALTYLRGLAVSAPEADAERLYYMLECARRLGRESDISNVLDTLRDKHPNSRWRMHALISAANYYLVRNDTARYVPLYSACAESFVDDPRAAYCHWKAAWSAYIGRQANARSLLREHIVKFPASQQASAALYFLGRMAEADGDPAQAKAFFREVLKRFPNHFYAVEAEKRMDSPAIDKAMPGSETIAFLRSVKWPDAPQAASFTPTPATKSRLERARLLQAAGLEDDAERELRFGARSENQPEILAVELARTAGKYDEPHRALQLVKSLAPDYMRFGIDDAPGAFWRILFPLPWRSSLERHSHERDLDPFAVAGLIRQESEFNPKAVSPARAYGLTQVMPATGRQMLKMSPRRFRPTILFNPDTNLRLGTTYLKHVLDTYTGRWECALAAYNAGPSRVKEWLTWGDFKERAEFIETIPFSETRSYVMAVLRNAEMYRRIYAKPSTDDGEPVPAAKKAAEPSVEKSPSPAMKKSPSPKTAAVSRKMVSKKPARATAVSKKRTSRK